MTQPVNTIPEQLKAAFEDHKRDPVAKLIVDVRRHRAGQIRDLLSNPATITLETFNAEVWPIERLTLIRSQNSPVRVLDARSDNADMLHRALDAGDLELHGNYIWGSATRIYGPMLKNEDEKLQYLRELVRILNDHSLTPLTKAQHIIRDVKGCGNNTATGLVMVFHPDEFALYNSQSKDAIAKTTGYAVKSLDIFEDAVSDLKDKLEAADFIELDYFLYLLNNGHVKITATGPDYTSAQGQPIGEHDNIPKSRRLNEVGMTDKEQIDRMDENHDDASIVSESTVPQTVGQGTNVWRIHFPREWWPEARRAGVIGINWDINSTNQSVQRFKRIAVGDRIVAYVQGGAIGGIGIVTRPYYDTRLTDVGGAELFGGNYPQRINVAWADAPATVSEILSTLQQPHYSSLYNRLKNPHTVVKLSLDDYRALLDLLGTRDPTHEENSRLPTAWPRLRDYRDFVYCLDEQISTAAALYQQARDYDEGFNMQVDEESLVDNLRQLRLLASIEEGYILRPYIRGDDVALLRLMVLALLIPVEGSSDAFTLPAQAILPRLKSAGSLAQSLFAPELGSDGRRLLAWYAEAGLVTQGNETWQAVPGAIDPLQGDDPTTLAYNEFLDTLWQTINGALRTDLEPVEVTAPLPPVQKLDERLQLLDRELLIDPQVVRRIIRSLQAGHHVILSGPPGTGKTELAKRLPTLFWEEDEQSFSYLPLVLNSQLVERRTQRRSGYHPVVVTATEDWGVRDVVGGIAPRLSGDGAHAGLSYAVQYGHVTRTALLHYEQTNDGRQLPRGCPVRRDYVAENGERYRGAWLVIDEFTRAPIDAAFGSLLTALGNPRHAELDVPSGDFRDVTLPLPADFRIIGTLNSFDRHFLNQMSEAMKRRFDFIDILPPSPAHARYEQGIAVFQALRRLQENGFKAIVVEDSTAYRWLGVLSAVLTTTDTGALRYVVDTHDETAKDALGSFWRVFMAIRVFRQLGTAQAVTVYVDLFAGVLMGMPWDVALDAALADSLVDQLQVLLGEEQDVLSAYVSLAGEATAFVHRVREISTSLPAGRRQFFVHSLKQAYARRFESVTGTSPSTLADDLSDEQLLDIFQPEEPLALPAWGLFQRGLHDLRHERGL